MNDLDIFVYNLKAIMKEYSLDQKALAQRIGCTTAVISMVLTRKQAPSLNFIIKTGKTFNLTFQEMFTPNNGVELKTYDNKDELINRLNQQLIDARDEAETLRTMMKGSRDDTESKYIIDGDTELLYINGILTDFEDIHVDVRKMQANVLIKLDKVIAAA